MGCSARTRGATVPHARARSSRRGGALAGLPVSRATATAVPRMAFQPVVDLTTDDVVGFEALARGPAGSPWERPQDLFAQARAEGRLRELDWGCRVAAVRDVLASTDGPPPWRLFLNAEAEVLGSTCPEELLEDWLDASGGVDVVVDVTDRALEEGPRRLLEAVEELRGLGCEIALDDVGPEAAGVALLPVIEPDIVKVDAALLRAPQSPEAMACLRAVESHVARTGAQLVVERIETEQDRAEALALGARWGQGYLLGRPAPLDEASLSRAGGGLPHRPVRTAVPAVPAGRPVVVGADDVRARLLRVAELAWSDAATSVLLLRVPDASLVSWRLSQLLHELRAACGLSAVEVGRSAAPDAPSPRPVEGGSPATLAVVLGPAVAHVVVATPRPDGRFDLVLSGEPAVAAQAARAFFLPSTEQPGGA